jgi:hypothetical protein
MACAASASRIWLWAELNGLAGGSAIAMIGGISAVLVGTVFLVATYLH